MRYSEVITLIHREVTYDSAGYIAPSSDIERTVYADSTSAKRQEFYAGLQVGRAITKIFKVRCIDYHDEELVRHDNTLYEVIRAYTKDGEMIELICEEVKRRAIAE